MNLLKFAGILLITTCMLSCSKEAQEIISNDETNGLTVVKTITVNSHTINLYTENGKLQTGYNKIFIQIKDASGSAIKDAAINWSPVMKMTTMSHACPYSTIKKATNTQSLYEGFIAFQMAGNSMESWELTINYTIGSSSYTTTTTIDVTEAPKKTIQVFKGTDNVKYVLVLVAPSQPKVATNDMEVLLFKMQDMMTFPVVNNYTIKIDPRMPGMGNHGSPNNVNLTQKEAEGAYFGKLSLTMTGYWKINLQLENESGEVLKGEAVTESVESSSIYFEIEF